MIKITAKRVPPTGATGTRARARMGHKSATITWDFGMNWADNMRAAAETMADREDMVITGSWNRADVNGTYVFGAVTR